jgi:DNA repair protein RadD
MTFALRPYQQTAVDDIRAVFAKQIRSTLLVLATGAGKTVCFSYIAKSAAALGRRVLILAHRDTLIKQASRKLAEYEVHHGIIMAGMTPNPTALVQVASVQTMVRRIRKRSYNFDLIIVDEAHLSVANTYREVIAAFPDAYLLGVTGSPCRLDGKGLGLSAGGLYETMVQGVSIRELIDMGFLVRPAVYGSAMHIDMSGVRISGGEYNAADLEAAVDKADLIGDCVDHYKRICPGVPAVAWCASIKHSQHVADQFNAAGIPAIVLSGESSPDERDRGLADLAAGRIKVITFAQLLIEGIDCPAIGCVMMLRPTMSLASFLQVIGRGLRPVEGKDRCYILDHAGLTMKHGFADDIREWSLDGVAKKKGKKKAVDEVKVKQCDHCYYCHPPAPACPHCGHEYPVASREPDQVDGTLQEITQEMRDAMRRDQRHEQGRAKTVDELMAATGMSRFRAQAIVKAREEKSALHDELVADLRSWAATTGEFPGPTFGASFGEIRKMKPKELKELRARFDAHRAARTGSGESFFELEGV